MRTLDWDGRRWAFLVIVVGILVFALCSNFVSYAGVHAQDVSPAPGMSFTTSSVVSSGSDDAGTDPEGCLSQSGYYEIYFGQCNDGSAITSGFLFRALAIPQGAHIENAYVYFTVDGTYANTLALSVYGEAAGNAEPFGANSQPADRALTAAHVPWSITPDDVWEMNESRQTPDLTSVVQEIVNRSDWVVGNALAIIVKNAGPATPAPGDPVDRLHRRVFAFERAQLVPPYLTARLVVTYDVLEQITPVCRVAYQGTNAQEQAVYAYTVQDSESGVAEVVVTEQQNVTFKPAPGQDGHLGGVVFGTTETFIVKATQVDALQPGLSALRVKDVAGNAAVCDLAAFMAVRSTGKPALVTMSGVAKAKHVVTIFNGAPGLKNLDVIVNGVKIKVAGAADNAIAQFDIGTALHDGDNTITVTAYAKPGSRAAVVIGEAAMAGPATMSAASVSVELQRPMLHLPFVRN